MATGTGEIPRDKDTRYTPSCGAKARTRFGVNLANEWIVYNVVTMVM